MSTNRQFNNMIKEYMPYKLLWDEMVKRDYLLTKVQKDNKWKSGELRVPFRYGDASSIKMGGLTSVANITRDKHAVGVVPTYKEMWGTMLFHDRDLQEHGDMTQSFISILPSMLTNFIDNFREQLSIKLLNGAHIASCSAIGTVLGVVTVDKPSRFTIGQYVVIGTVGAAPNAVGWVKNIDMKAKTLLINDSLELSGAAVDCSAVLATDKVYIDGHVAGGVINAALGFTSLRDQFLSAANGGLTNQFGIAKTDYPFLQAYNYDGSGIGSGNILGTIFDAYNETREIGKGMPTEVWMSFKNLAQAMKELEVSTNYSTVASPRAGTAGGKGPKAQVYNWTEIDVVGVKGKLKLVGINEMDDDVMPIVDSRTFKLHSNGFIERRVSPEGKHYYEVRNDDGYTYVTDHRFFGELVVSQPSYNGIIYGIHY